MEAIKTVDLTKRYRDLTAVDGLSLTVEKGEAFALLGINGAGKTTAIKMLCGLVAPTSGEAELNGYSVVKEPAKVKSVIGVSPQETAVAPNLSVRENLALLCGAYGFSKPKSKSRVETLLKDFGLEEIAGKKAGKLSGGWQRRLSIAMALVGEPKILFLDEPSLGLDVLARSELWTKIRALKGEITLVLTTHYMEEAEALADRIGIMKAGKLIALGSAEGLKERAGAATLEQAFVSLVGGEA